MRPQEEQPQLLWQLWKPGFSLRRNYGARGSRFSVRRAWRLRGGAADLLSSGQERPRCPGPSRPLPVPGEAGSWAVSRRPVLRGLRCWIRAPAPQPPPRSRRPSPSELLRSVPPCALQPLGSSAHSPGAQVSVSVPGSPRASPPSWVLLQLPASPFPPAREGWCSSCSSGTGLSCPGDTRPGLSPAPRGAPPPRRPFVPLFLFPRLPTLIEARTLLTVAFQLVSL